jgi:hypothetical protein
MASSSKVLRYTLDNFSKIINDGFHIELPTDTLAKITHLATQVGSDTYVQNPVFEKKESIRSTVFATASEEEHKKKNRRNKESSSDDWESVRSFQATKIEVKEGAESVIRTCLNKLTDKNYEDTKTSILAVLPGANELNQVVAVIFEIASTNRFYSKLYAELYKELCCQNEAMLQILLANFQSFLSLFQKIEFVDAKIDYELFCKCNKDNEKRKALSAFYMNLMELGLLQKSDIFDILTHLFNQIYTLISEENKKSEVDEIGENIGLLFNNDMKSFCENSDFLVGNKIEILDFIEIIANSKVKNYKSLTNKTIFKFADLLEENDD